MSQVARFVFLAIVLSKVVIFYRPCVILRFCKLTSRSYSFFFACNPSQSFYVKLCFYFLSFYFLPCLLCLVVCAFICLVCLFIYIATALCLHHQFHWDHFYFACQYSKYVCLLLLFRYPRCSCLLCRLSSSRRVGRVIETASKIDEYVSLLLFQSYTFFFFYPFNLLFYVFFIFIYFILSIFFVPVFRLPSGGILYGKLMFPLGLRGLSLPFPGPYVPFLLF